MLPRPSSRFVLAIIIGAVLVLVALIAGVDVSTAAAAAGVGFGLAAAFAVIALLQTHRAWRAADVRMERTLPAAFALGVHRSIELSFTAQGTLTWRCRVFDHIPATVVTDTLPVSLAVAGGKRTSIAYEVLPTRRGEATFDAADVFVASRLGLWELRTRIGNTQTLRIYPDFAQVARYAWLAGDRRLAEIGIKTYQQRGEGTDFKQLAEYRIGDQIRHIDWKATARARKPIVRQFQNERDQCVLLLIDSGRRMRADDRQTGIGAAHFDQVLNATMLLTYVALKQGDAVGAMTFGAPPGTERWFPPRKGAHVLNALMSALYDVQPAPTYSDYVAAARDLMRRQRKRSLVIVITNFRDEDAGELGTALRLLRTRHLVLTASLRERIVDELAAQPIEHGDAALEVASAHLYEQARRDSFNRIAARDALMIDALPERLGVELVNRYQAVKRAGLI